MTEHNLTILLEDAAERHAIGEPPLDRMLANTRRRSRNRRASLVAATSMATLIVGTAWVIASDSAEPGRGLDYITQPTTQYPPEPPDGDAAFWSLAPGQELTQDTTELKLLVTRGGCNGGQTGQVLGPGLVSTEETVRITFSVPHVDGGRCPGNDSVPVTVRLPEPLGGRSIIDGQCINDGSALLPAYCGDDHGVRWRPTSR